MSIDTALHTFLDVEASGLSQADSYPIEVGWSDTLGNYDSFLIKPAPGWGWDHWDRNSQLIHGISREQLSAEGICVQATAQCLNSSLGVETVYCDAIDFDSFWISRLFEAADMEPSFTLVDIFELYDDLPRDHVLAMFYYLKNTHALHLALADAERYSMAYCWAARSNANLPTNS